MLLVQCCYDKYCIGDCAGASGLAELIVLRNMMYEYSMHQLAKQLADNASCNSKDGGLDHLWHMNVIYIKFMLGLPF